MTMNKLLNSTKWLILAALAVHSTGEAHAAAETKKDQRSQPIMGIGGGGFDSSAISQASKLRQQQNSARDFNPEAQKEQMYKAMEASALKDQRIAQICDKSKLNPEYGIGDIDPLGWYTHDSAFRDIQMLSEPIWGARYRETWEAWHAGMSGDQRSNYRFPAVDVARLVVAVGGKDAVKKWQERMEEKDRREERRKEANLLGTDWKERGLKSVSEFTALFGTLFITGLTEAPKYYKEILTATSYIVGVFATILFVWYGVPALINILFRDPMPIIVKEKYLSYWLPKNFRGLRWKVWRYSYLPWNFFNRQKVDGNIKELHYTDAMTKWLAKSIEDDKNRVVKNQKNKGKFEFTTVLLKGPPGTGKTAFAKAYASEADFDYIHVGGSAWSMLPEEEALKHFNSTIARAKSNPRPVLLFIDEIDVVFGKRAKTTGVSRKLTSAFLEAVEKAHNPNIKFVFATNLASELSDAVVSRCGEQIDVEVPLEAGCQKIYSTYIKKYCKQYDVDCDDVNVKLYGLTGRDIELICLQLAESVALAGKKNIKAVDIEEQFTRKLASVGKSAMGEQLKNATVIDEEDTKKKTENDIFTYLGFLALALLVILSIFLYRTKNKQKTDY